MIIETLKNDTLDDFKKTMIALKYLSLIRGNNNIEDKYTKRLSDTSYENKFGFK